MPGQRVAPSTWSQSLSKSHLEGPASFPLAFWFGPYRLARLNFALTTVDLGPLAISGEDFDSRLLPSDQPLFLRSAPDRLGLATSSLAESMLVYPFYSYPRSWVETAGSFDAYLSSFSKTSRKGLTRRTKKLTELSGGRLDIRRYDQPDDMAVFHDHARTVSAKTFQEKLMDEGLPADRSFLDKMTRMALAGACYGSILYLDDRPISYLYCEQQGPGWLASYGGFDPAHARLSPGTVHLVKDLEDAFDDPDCAFFDLGPGGSDYKQFFSTHDVPCCDILVLDSHVTNHLAVASHRALVSLTTSCRALAEALRMRERLRQRIRGR